MNIIAYALASAFILWFFIYFRLAWNKGGLKGPSYYKMFFPIALFMSGLWQDESKPERVKLQMSLLIITIITAIANVIKLDVINSILFQFFLPGIFIAMQFSGGPHSASETNVMIGVFAQCLFLYWIVQKTIHVIQSRKELE